ncbi:MAG: acetyltransferase ribosomal protein [Planctomycetota bacterium]|nr:MAG: acetyltransferase ribosomal protein [Planctomycetota bacterium]
MSLDDFAKEVSQSDRVYIVRDSRGVPAPIAPGGRRALPAWSSHARVQRIIAKDAEFAGFKVDELPWGEFRDTWIPRCEANNWLVGINWAGDTAIGMDVEPKDVRAAVEGQVEAEQARLVVETSRLWLREFTSADLEALAAIYADAATTRWLGDGSTRDREGTKSELERYGKLYRERGFGPWAVVPKETGEVAGHCGLQDLEGTPTVALSFALAAKWRGKGLATEAARAALTYGLETLKLSRVVAVAQITNVESVGVLKKIGMRLEGEEFHYGKQVLVYVAHRAGAAT